jgi:hypothetical protein
MVVSALTVEEMIAGWPYPELPLITAEPTYEDIAMMQKRLNANFLSIPSNAGGGRHGHLGLLMTAGQYTAISPVPFVAAADPGPVALVLLGTDDIVAANMVRMYDEQKRAFITRVNCDEGGKKLILAAFPNMYTSALEDYLLGYAGVTVRELVQYIIHTYSRIDPTQLADCYTKMTRPYDLQDPIETLFTQIDDGVRYALAGGQPYGEAQYVNIAFLLILATQSLPLACAEWQRRVPNMQSWPLFKAFFTEAHRENRMISQTALRSGYHTANMATELPTGTRASSNIAHQYNHPHLVPEAPSEITTVLANLATATGADRATVAALTKSLAELTAVTKAQAEELRRLIQSGHTASTPGTTNHSSATVVRGNGRQRRSGTNDQGGGGRPLYKTNNNNYCWSHGYQVGLQHTSATCTTRKAGHNPAATKTDIMGGDTWGSELL